jgi:hypothetical protein
MNACDDHKQKKKLFHFKIHMISYYRFDYGDKVICQAPKLISALK